MRIENKRRYYFAFVSLSVLLLGIFGYNYFELCNYKNLYKDDLLSEVLKAKFKKIKCNFNLNEEGY